MPVAREWILKLQQTPDLTIVQDAELSQYTRFGIGGPAELYVEASTECAFMDALRLARWSDSPYVVIGSGTNLIASDSGFAGIVLRLAASGISREGLRLRAEGGGELQTLVDYSIDLGLKGIETMTGIPGSVGAAVYGNAGAYGHSMMERVGSVRFFDGQSVRAFSNAECLFQYRESVFKTRKDWVILTTDLEMEAADPMDLRRTADSIRAIRDEKYPRTMKCAGSIFKNLIWRDLPPEVQTQVPGKVVREGKVPSAWFLEQVGAKGMDVGGIRVATYHANLIYNEGGGTARELVQVIRDLKTRVRDRFGFDLEEEVQYLGLEKEPAAYDSIQPH